MKITICGTAVMEAILTSCTWCIDTGEGGGVKGKEITGSAGGGNKKTSDGRKSRKRGGHFHWRPILAL